VAAPLPGECLVEVPPHVLQEFHDTACRRPVAGVLRDGPDDDPIANLTAGDKHVFVVSRERVDQWDEPLELARP
jgi:hypothetical protein